MITCRKPASGLALCILCLGLVLPSAAACAQEAPDSSSGIDRIVQDKEMPGRPPAWYYRDPLSNRSCLSDEDLRYYFEHHQEHSVARDLLDKDRDGIVDGMDISVCEFLARMALILSDRLPFDYKCDIYGNPIECERPDPPVDKAM